MVPELDIVVAGQYTGGALVPLLLVFIPLVVVIVLTTLWNRR